MTKTYTFDDDIISDLHKDAYGMRPCEGFWRRWEEATEDEKQAQWDWLLQAQQRAEAEAAAFEKAAIESFESRVVAAIAMGAQDRETALRWIMDADGANGDWERLCYLNGLPFNYFK